MIWVIAGTVNARELIIRLLHSNYPVLASVATEFGRGYIDVHRNLTVLSGPMSKANMADIIRKHGVRLIIDSSHPYSIEVSSNAMNAALGANIPYIRYERKSIKYPEALVFTAYAGAAEYLKDKQGNILLTIGSKNLNFFSSKEFDGRIYARVLPLKDSLTACADTGIKPDKILAMNFHFSKEFHKQLYRDLNIRYLVTKESGEEGWVNEKVMAAFETDVKVVLIKRPAINYPDISYSIDDILGRVGSILNG